MTQWLEKKPKRQQIRLRRLIYALYGGAIHTLVCVLMWASDFIHISKTEFIWTFGLIWVVNAVFFVILNLGLNERFKDQSLTIPMMVWAISCNMYSVYLTAEIREVLLMFHFFILVFGTFHLAMKPFISMVFYGMATYFFLLKTLQFNHPDLMDPHADWIGFVCFSLISFAYIVIAREMASIRIYLREKNKNLLEALEKIESISITDELTKIKNRRYILDILNQQVSIAQRNSYHFSVCLIDVDFFKDINDAYGHLCGDDVLVYLCRTIGSVMRQSDYFARFGGEEFLMVLPLTDLEHATQVADRVRTMVQNTQFNTKHLDLKVRVSVGVTEYQASESVESLLGRVDKALYQAKAKGRNNVVALLGTEKN